MVGKLGTSALFSPPWLSATLEEEQLPPRSSSKDPGLTWSHDILITESITMTDWPDLALHLSPGARQRVKSAP